MRYWRDDTRARRHEEHRSPAGRLIAECHGIIRDLVRPAWKDADPVQRSTYIHAVSSLADSAVKLGDAIGRLRGTAPSPELRQRITVEKVQRLSAPRGEGDG